MLFRLRQVLRLCLAPMLLLALAGTALWFAPQFPPRAAELLPLLPPIAICVGLLLSVLFNRSQFLFVLLGLLFAHAVQLGLLRLSSQGVMLASAWCALNFALFGLLKNRGAFSVHGLLRLGLLAAQAGLSAWALAHWAPQLEALRQWQWLPAAPLQGLWQPPQALLALVLGTFALMLGRLLFSPRHIEAGLLWALTAFALALAEPGRPLWSGLFVSASALILCVAVLLDSLNMAYRDELTGLPSRRALNQSLLNLGRTYTIAMLDVDHFKKFNDTHGHDVGDQVLKLVARKIGEVTGGGRGYRYGGEEFTVVFPGRTPSQARAHLEALRESIAEYEMVLRSAPRPKNDKHKPARKRRGSAPESGRNTVSVTISIGVASRSPERKLPEQVIKAADQALYRAKEKGRNCVSL